MFLSEFQEYLAKKLGSLVYQLGGETWQEY